MTRDRGGGDRSGRTAASGCRCAEQWGGRCTGRPLAFYRSPGRRRMRRRGVTSRGAGGGCRASVAANVVAVNLADLSVQNWGTKREARESLTHGPLRRVTAEFASAAATAARSSRPRGVSAARPLNRANAASAEAPAISADRSGGSSDPRRRRRRPTPRAALTPVDECSFSADPTIGLSSGFTAALLIDA